MWEAHFNQFVLAIFPRRSVYSLHSIAVYFSLNSIGLHFYTFKAVSSKVHHLASVLPSRSVNCWQLHGCSHDAQCGVGGSLQSICPSNQPKTQYIQSIFYSCIFSLNSIGLQFYTFKAVSSKVFQIRVYIPYSWLSHPKSQLILKRHSCRAYST